MDDADGVWSCAVGLSAAWSRDAPHSDSLRLLHTTGEVCDRHSIDMLCQHQPPASRCTCNVAGPARCGRRPLHFTATHRAVWKEWSDGWEEEVWRGRGTDRDVGCGESGAVALHFCALTPPLLCMCPLVPLCA